MTAYVLDSSAVLAFLNQEPGKDLVEEHLADSCISTVNLSETVAVLNDLLKLDLKDIRNVLDGVIPEIVPFSKEQSYLAGAYRKKTKSLGLSIGDRACLALAATKKLPVLTCDKIWEELALDIEIVQIR